MFITFEGPDGSGKTTQVRQIMQILQAEGYDPLLTREPGGTAVSDQIREIIMSMKNKCIFPRTEILLFCSARAQLIEEVIRPALSQGQIIISDRYSDSTLAYQGFGHGFDQVTLKQILNFATGNLWPDLTILLDISAQQGLERRLKNQEEWNRMDDYQLSFHQRVREGYHQLAAAEPHRWRIVDAAQSKEDVTKQILTVLHSALEK